MHREPLLALLLLHFPALLRALAAFECTPCAHRTCPSAAAAAMTGARACEEGRMPARDPCGCCAPLCTRLELELCGGRDWTLGYCGLGLTCAALNRTGAANIPEIGVCKGLPDATDAGAEDERCPLVSGCDRVSGVCVCDSIHSCIKTFSYPNRESCTRAAKTEAQRHEQEHTDRHRARFVGPANPSCVFSGCNLTAKGCECTSHSCHPHFTYANRSQCQQAAGPVSAPLCKEKQDEHCQSRTAVNVSDQTIRNRPHEGGLRARRPLVGPVLTGQHCRARLAFATEHQNWQVCHRRLVLFTDESRFYLSTCDRRDRLWRRCGECYATCKIIQHDWFGGGSVMVWGGIFLEGRTDLYRLYNGTLTAIRYQDEILGLVVRPYAGAVGPGFLLVHNNARPHVARVCRQFLENKGIDTIGWPTGSPNLNPIELLWDIMFRSIQRHQVALQTVQELSDALVQNWEEIPQDTIHVSLGALELKCVGITCSTLPTTTDCPPDSVLTHTYTPPGGCCPTMPSQCTCRQCSPQPECLSGHRAVVISEATGAPGNCCHVYDCQRISPKCVHNGKQFAEGEVYRMDPCWLCQCRGGISFCSKAECAELECDNFYIPEGECCPVCIDVELLSVDSTKASCWVNHKLRQHEEQWKEDDCTFCQCVDGEPHCTAMACKQSCQNPVKIPGECCPFCEEPSYETVSPLLCPPLENCSLSEKDCPYGFQQDHNGCLLCQCLGNDSCPELSKYCNLQCPMGYEKDDFGCEVCECSIPSKCKPLTCSKTCPHGYMRNKHGCEMCRCIKCPPFTCDKQCSDGYKQNRKGCSVCLCKESDHAVTTPPPLPSYCLTANGLRFEEGESWHDGCRDCYCHAGREMCMLISCPVPTCIQPVLRPHQCCPTCEDESGSGQIEGMDMVVCRAPGGDLYVEGETWNLDECTRCTCRQGRVLCDSEVCPPTLCQTPTRNKDTCCYICPEDTLSSLLPVNNSQHEYCISSDGDVLLAGDSWKPNACTSCICNNGTVQCFSQRCPTANCRVPVLRKGQCCPHCLEVTTTSAPMMISTTTAKPKAKITTTTAESGTVWITMHTVPPVVAITDDRGLSEDAPNQTEMSLIYQSAAWILAGLLLAIVIFLFVALLINKKKKWVQMSCYSAPKKTVILKKHVKNKNSVVYMEPSKENKFQSVKNDYGMTFSPDVSSPCGERISIPRAKLSNGHARVQR
ncbi:hypothetical protein NFI96_033099 [Prochilodus magdalenae]|nr:hypothetical protein NFI96_033099 [Prochilodus magdalenae]